MMILSTTASSGGQTNLDFAARRIFNAGDGYYTLVDGKCYTLSVTVEFDVPDSLGA
jgi:hypothetical protein